MSAAILTISSLLWHPRTAPFLRGEQCKRSWPVLRPESRSAAFVDWRTDSPQTMRHVSLWFPVSALLCLSQAASVTLINCSGRRQPVVTKQVATPFVMEGLGRNKHPMLWVINGKTWWDWIVWLHLPAVSPLWGGSVCRAALGLQLTALTKSTLQLSNISVPCKALTCKTVTPFLFVNHEYDSSAPLLCPCRTFEVVLNL